MTPPITREEAKAVIDRLCSRAEYSPDAIERLTLAAYFEQDEAVEKERDQLRAKLAYETKRALCPGCVEGESNARLAAVVREHGRVILEAIEVALNDDEIDEVEENASAMMVAAAKALAEALK